jgi:general secretion pathway protein M
MKIPTNFASNFASSIATRIKDNAFFMKIDAKINELQVMVSRLPKREQMALLSLSVFLVVAMIGGGGYWLHHKAELIKENADQQRQLLLWMRGQAPYLQATSGPVEPLSTIVQEAAAQQGITITQTETAGRLVVTADHQSFSVLGTWLTNLAQSGIQVDTLAVEQVGGILQLKATLTKP